jgi:hypothetical protein
MLTWRIRNAHLSMPIATQGAANAPNKKSTNALTFADRCRFCGYSNENGLLRPAYGFNTSFNSPRAKKGAAMK